MSISAVKSSLLFVQKDLGSYLNEGLVSLIADYVGALPLSSPSLGKKTFTAQGTSRIQAYLYLDGRTYTGRVNSTDPSMAVDPRATIVYPNGDIYTGRVLSGEILKVAEF